MTPFSSQAKQLICVGHRGACGYEPENTLRSFTKGVELGVPWIECDVRLVDKHLVLFHDRSLQRRANHSGILTDFTFDYLRTLDVGKGEKIPLLSEAVELLTSLAGNSIGLNVEIKGEGCAEALAPYLLGLLDDGWPRDKLIISSFDHHQLKRCKELAPEIHRALLIYGYPLDAIATARQLEVAAIFTHLDAVTPARVKEIHSAGFSAGVFTVNEPSDIELMRSWGVEVIFSDFPDRGLKITPP